VAAPSAELPSRPALVGREGESARLRDGLDAALAGRGTTLLIAGEAGIGKTRLLDELRDLARNRGVRVMSGTCFAENLTPYIAYVEAFREGKLEHLFAEEAVRVETVYLVTRPGVLLAKAERAESPIDPDIFMAMLQVVENFVRDSLDRAGVTERSLNVLGYGDYRILVEPGEHVNLVAVVTGRENEFLLQDIQAALRSVEAQFGDLLRVWRGDLGQLAGIEAPLGSLLASDKYEGLDPAKADPQVRRNRLFENISLGLIREARRGPILLCLDDLQWADPSTLALTHYVSRNAREAGLLLVGTYRAEEVGAPPGQRHPLVETLQLMSREGLYEQIDVRRLEPGEVRAFLEGLLGRIEFPEDFDPGVFRESGGNPFFLLELTRMMVAEGVLERRGESWHITRPLSELEIPARIQHVVLRRVQRLDSAQRDLLDLAAVIGESFRTDVLARTLGQERVPLLKRMRPLEEEHQLVRSLEEGFRFDHAKVREVLYGETPEQLRREYHGMVGVALEQLHPQDPEAVVADLAHHFYQARNRVKGVQYAVRAGERARALYANAEAIHFLAQALELMGSDARWRDSRLPLLETVGDLRDLVGHFDGACRAYGEVLEAGPDAEMRARMHRKRGSVLQRRGDYGQAEAELQAAEAALVGVSAELGRVRLWRGRLEHRRGDYARAEELLRGAAGIIAQAGGDEADTAEAEDSLAFVHWVRQEIPDARRHWERCVELRRKVDDQKGLRAGYNNLANTFAAVQDWENALRHYHESLRIAQNIGDSAGVVKPLTNIGRIHQLLGRPEEAIAAFERALKTSVRIGDQRGVASLHRNLGSLFEDRARLDGAREHYARCLEMAERIGEGILVAGATSGLASIAAKRGELAEAQRGYERSLELFRKIHVPDDIAYTATALAWLHLQRGDVGGAAGLLQEAEGVAGAVAVGHVAGALEGVRGAVARRRGEEAEQTLRRALDLLPPFASFELIRVKRELGALLQERGDPAGRSLVAEALELARKTGDASTASEVERLLG